MNHIFCSGCGTKLQYNLAKPNFCTKCGCSLSSTSVAKSISPQKSYDDEEEDTNLEEDETNINSIPKLRGLEFEIENYSANQSFTFGSLLGENSTPTYQARRRSRSIDEFIDEKKS